MAETEKAQHSGGHHVGLTADEKARLKQLEGELAGNKVVEPNKDERDTKLERLKKQIEALYSTMNEVRAQEDQERSEKDERRRKIRQEVRDSEPVNEKQQMVNRVKDLSEEITQRYKQMEEHRNAIKKIQDEKKAVLELLPQGTLNRDYKTADDVDVEIKRLEFSLETEGSGLKREKRLMQSIKALQDLKASLKNKDTVQGNLDSLKQATQDRLAAREENVKVLDELKKEREDLKAKLDNLRNARDAREAELMKDLPGGGAGQSDKRKSLHAQITKLKDEQRSIRELFDKERDKFFSWKKQHQELENLKWKDEQARRNEDRRKREEEWNKRNEEKRKQRMESEKVKRLNPKEEEIQMCINLTNELRTHLKAKKEEKKVVDFDASSAAPSQYQVLKKAEAEDDWLYGDRTKKKAAAKPASAPKPVAKEAKEALPQKQKSLQLSMQSRRALELVGVQVPRFTSEIQATIEELAKKKVDFESEKRSEAEVDAELKAEWDAAELKRQQQAEANAADEGEAPQHEGGYRGRGGRRGGRGDRGGRSGRGGRGGRGGGYNSNEGGSHTEEQNGSGAAASTTDEHHEEHAAPAASTDE